MTPEIWNTLGAIADLWFALAIVAIIILTAIIVRWLW
jgi:hypothetical protein